MTEHVSSVEGQKRVPITTTHCFQGLLEQVSGTLQLGPFVPLNKLRKVGLPDIFDMRPFEKGNPTLVGLERVLKELIFLYRRTVMRPVQNI